MPVSSTASLPVWTLYIPTLAPLITWSLVIAGWRIVSNDNNLREKRKELRADIGKVIDVVDALEIKAIKYYMLGVNDETRLLEVEIKRDLKVLEAKLTLLSASESRFQTANMQRDLQTTLTGGDFEQSNRQPRLHNDGKLIEISSSTRELISFVESTYIAKYTSVPFWQKLRR